MKTNFPNKNYRHNITFIIGLKEVGNGLFKRTVSASKCQFSPSILGANLPCCGPAPFWSQFLGTKAPSTITSTHSLTHFSPWMHFTCGHFIYYQLEKRLSFGLLGVNWIVQLVPVAANGQKFLY